MDPQGQLEKRLAVGDKTFLSSIKNEEDRKLMETIVEDIQKQLLTHNTFVKLFTDEKKFCDNNPEVLQDQPAKSKHSVTSWFLIQQKVI